MEEIVFGLVSGGWRAEKWCLPIASRVQSWAEAADEIQKHGWAVMFPACRAFWVYDRTSLQRLRTG